MNGRQPDIDPTTDLVEEDEDQALPEPVPQGAVEAAAGQIVELAVTWQSLGLEPGRQASFFIALRQDGQELERHPSHQPLVVAVPARDFAARHWSV